MIYTLYGKHKSSKLDSVLITIDYKQLIDSEADFEETILATINELDGTYCNYYLKIDD